MLDVSKSLAEWIKIVGGRKRYNKQRQLEAARRRHRIVRLRAIDGVRTCRALAGRLGVSAATVCRDLRVLNSTYGPGRKCPACRSFYWDAMPVGYCPVLDADEIARRRAEQTGPTVGELMSGGFQQLAREAEEMDEAGARFEENEGG